LTAKDHPDYKTLEEAQSLIHSVNQEIQEKNREREDRGKILEIANKVTGMPSRVVNILINIIILILSPNNNIKRLWLRLIECFSKKDLWK
jgi:hypothetical protein